MDKNTPKKVLLFEGAGMNYEVDELSDVGNYRIQTAFINNDGVPVYFECSGNTITKAGKDTHWRTYLHQVSYLTDYCDGSLTHIAHNWNDPMFGYNKAGIVNLVNSICNTSFEDMEVLDDMEGYRVFGGKREYNLMDDHVINRERTAARIKAYAEVDAEYRKRFGSKYSVIRFMSMDAESITIQCYASREQVQRAGMTEDELIRVIPINYKDYDGGNNHE
jgi:hypothetical protein